MSDRDLIRRDAAISIVMRDRIKMNTSGTEFCIVSTQDHIEALRAIPAVVTAQPDPRDEVIKGLMEALEWCVDALERDYRGSATDCEIPQDIRAALAAAKAVQK